MSDHLPNFQQKVVAFVAEHQLEAPVETRLLDLVAEVGEAVKEVLKGSDYGRHPFEASDEWAAELADAFFSLICVANSTDVNLETALEQVLDKYQQRLSRAGDAGSGR